MTSGTFVLSEEQLVVFCSEGSLGRHGTCMCECTGSSAGISALSVLCSTVCLSDQMEDSGFHVCNSSCCAPCMCLARTGSGSTVRKPT